MLGEAAGLEGENSHIAGVLELIVDRPKDRWWICQWISTQ